MLAARLTEDPDVERPAARGRRPGHRAGDPRPGDVPDHVQVEPRLGPDRRRGAGSRRASAVPAARPHDRRLQLDQRDDLPPRQPRSTTTTGPRSGCATAGATTRCCRTSSAARTTSAARDAYHGVGGPQTVSDSRSMHPLVDLMLEAAVQAGHAANPDLNGAVQDGVGRFQLTQRGGLRCSTADAYLHPAADRPNLEVQRLPSRRADRLRGQPRRRRRGRPERRARDDPRRARGDRLGGRLPVAGAADALRHRPARRSSRRSGSRCASSCRSAATSRTTSWRTSTTSAPSRRSSGSSRRRTSSCCTRRAAGRSARTCPRPAASSARVRTCRRRTSSSTSRRRSSTTRASPRRTTTATSSGRCS